MRGLFLYVTAGAGHKTPADALRDAMIDRGEQAESIDMFDLLKLPVIKQLIETTWRTQLRHPATERTVDAFWDTKLSARVLTGVAHSVPLIRGILKEYLDQTKPDFILGTHYFIASIIAPLIHALRYPVPVYGYVPDIFFYANVGWGRHMDKMYVCSPLGEEWLLKLGYEPDAIRLCPFPLKKSIETYKRKTRQEARAALGMDDRFTVLTNLGGEGIGNTRLVRRLAQSGFDGQMAVVGRMSRETEMLYDRFQKEYPSFRLYTPGFTDRMNDYITACDIQVGKAGANSMMESLCLKRPFIITEQLYASERVSLFLKDHPVGWVENEIGEQVKLIERYATDEELRKKTDQALDEVPFTFSSRAFVAQIERDTRHWYQDHPEAGRTL